MVFLIHGCRCTWDLSQELEGAVVGRSAFNPTKTCTPSGVRLPTSTEQITPGQGYMNFGAKASPTYVIESTHSGLSGKTKGMRNVSIDVITKCSNHCCSPDTRDPMRRGSGPSFTNKSGHGFLTRTGRSL